MFVYQVWDIYIFDTDYMGQLKMWVLYLHLFYTVTEIFLFNILDEPPLSNKSQRKDKVPS